MKALGIFGCSVLLGAVAIKQAPQVPRLACFSPDSGRIAYSRFDSASDGDVSGQEFAFAVQGGHLLGWYREAAGEIGPAQPLDSLQVGPTGDSVFFAQMDLSSSDSYRLRVTCRSLRGTALLFRSATYAGKRVRFMLRRARPVAAP
jgi:hypothetical protein